MKPVDYISVPLNPTDSDKEKYRERDENFIQVSVQNSDGKIARDENSRVVIEMSKDAMLALGSALVRASQNTESSRGCWELRPARKDEAIECLGVYLHPSSCQLVVNACSMGTLENELNTPT